MSFVDAVLHALNFCLPAVFMALLVTLSGRFFKKNRPLVGVFIHQFAINLIVTLGVLIVGVLLTGRDGKMYTYLAMITASGTVQWIVSGAWRK
jgi:flagellar biosynthesis protein FliR